MTAARLILVDATVELLEAAIDDPVRLGRLMQASVAQGWAGFPDALPALRSLHRDGTPWGTIFFVLDRPRVLIGLGGYKGSPSPEGVVEIGYAVAPAFRGRGLATEATRQLVRRAFGAREVHAVEAHTLAHPSPSTRVLEKIGFTRVAEQPDADEGRVWQWRLRRT